jgi:hypothetical protein
MAGQTVFHVEATLQVDDDVHWPCAMHQPQPKLRVQTPQLEKLPQSGYNEKR